MQRDFNRRLQSLEAVVADWEEDASNDLSPSVPCLGAPIEVDNCLFLHYIGGSLLSIIRMFPLFVIVGLDSQALHHLLRVGFPGGCLN